MSVISFLELILPNKMMWLGSLQCFMIWRDFCEWEGMDVWTPSLSQQQSCFSLSLPLTSLWISRGCPYRGVEQGTSVDVKTMQAGLKVLVCCLGVFCELWTVWQFVLWGDCCSVFQLSGCIRRQINVLFCHVSYSCPCQEREVERETGKGVWRDHVCAAVCSWGKKSIPGLQALGVFYFRELWNMKKAKPFVFSLNFLRLKQSLKGNWQKKRKKWKI